MIKFKSIAEQRLDFAFNCVQKVIEFKNSLAEKENQYLPTGRPESVSDDLQRSYHQYSKSLAMLILNSGLLAALVFTQGKANRKKENEPHSFIIDHLCSWLHKQDMIKGENSLARLDYLCKANSKQIRTATLEAVRFLEDLKRIGDARFARPGQNQKP